MKLITATIVSFGLAVPSLAQAQVGTGPARGAPTLTFEEVRSVSPALERYTQKDLLGDVWKRPGLSPRDRSIVTLSTLIARGQTIELPFHCELALDNGVRPGEISEIITHLAFYSGWANAHSAVAVVKDIFARRGVGADQLPEASPQLLPIDQASESRRAVSVQETVGPVSPGLVKDTGDLLFKDLWLRPDLAPRDRSLVTISSLIASGQFAQFAPHLNRAMDNGLTKGEASEVISHIAFYAGWPNAFSAVPIAKGVFESRTK
jgi:4-carboxymuconolactone decarboxylase